MCSLWLGKLTINHTTGAQLGVQLVFIDGEPALPARATLPDKGRWRFYV